MIMRKWLLYVQLLVATGILVCLVLSDAGVIPPRGSATSRILLHISFILVVILTIDALRSK